MRKAIILILILCIFITLSGFAGLGDWHLPLPNGYELSRSSAKTIYITRNNEFIIDSNIESFCISQDEKYVGAQKNTGEFYLLDTINHTLYGPIALKDWQAQLKEQSITEALVWKNTVPRPEGAIYTDGDLEFPFPVTLLIIIVFPAILIAILTVVFVKMYYKRRLLKKTEYMRDYHRSKE